MKFERVLFHTQFREYAFNSLKALLHLKKAGLKEVVLVYIIPREAVGFVPYGGYLKDVEKRIHAEAESHFKDWQKAIHNAGIRSVIRIKSGILNACILKIAEEEKVDLIVTGAKKRTTLEKIYVGSHILDILRRSQVPVLMGKYMVEFESDEGILSRKNSRIFERPLLATDWSDPSERGLSAIRALKGVVKSAVVAHVVDSKLIKGMDSSQIAELEKESNRRLAAYRERLRKEMIPAEIHLAIGKSVPEILRISRETEATLIIMGKTGKDWIEQYWLGGVSHRVAELSELPVLLVP